MVFMRVRSVIKKGQHVRVKEGHFDVGMRGIVTDHYQGAKGTNYNVPDRYWVDSAFGGGFFMEHELELIDPPRNFWRDLIGRVFKWLKKDQ